MIRVITGIIAINLAWLFMSLVKKQVQNKRKKEGYVLVHGRHYRAGDYVCSKTSDGVYLVTRILVIWPTDLPQTFIFHMSLWERFDHLPTLQEVQRTPPFVMHVPVARSEDSRREEKVILGNAPVTEADLEGFYCYLEAMRSDGNPPTQKADEGHQESQPSHERRASP
jgi:hypothetical protein